MLALPFASPFFASASIIEIFERCGTIDKVIVLGTPGGSRIITMVLLASLFFVLVDSVLRFIVKIVIGGGF